MPGLEMGDGGRSHLPPPVRELTTVEPHRRTLLPSSSESMERVPVMRPNRPLNPFCDSACSPHRHMQLHL